MNPALLPKPALTALASLLTALALGPVLQQLLPAWGWLLCFACYAGMLALQYVAMTEGNVRAYLTYSQILALAALAGGVAAGYWWHPAIGLALAIALSTSALLFIWPAERLFYAQCAGSFAIMLLGLSTDREGAAVAFWFAYSVLLSGLLLIRHQQEPLNRGGIAAYSLCLVTLMIVASLIYGLLPRWPLGPSSTQSQDTYIYADATWSSKAQDLRDGRLPAQILPQLQQQFLLDAQTAAAKTLADYAYQAAPPSNSFSYPPFNNSFELNNFASRLNWLDAPVARVEAASPMNLKAKIFDEFDGIRWHNSAVNLYQVPLQYGHLTWRSQLDQQGNPVAFRVQLLAPIGTAIPLTGQLDHLDFPATSLGFNIYGLLQSPSVLRPGTHYGARVHNVGLAQRSIGDPGHLQHPNYLQLPTNLDPRIKPLAEEISAKASSQLAQAERLENHLRSFYRGHFGAVSASVGVVPVTEFLFDTKRGTPEYFATSLVLMLRCVGIPARLVSGFAVQRRNPFTGLFDVLGADAHTWVEAYVDNKGWVELEPMALYRLPIHRQPAVLGLTQLHQWRRQQQDLTAHQPLKPPADWRWSVYFALCYTLMLLLIAGIIAVAVKAAVAWVQHHDRYLNWRKNRLIQQQRRQTRGQDPVAAPMACLTQLAELSGRQLNAGAPIEKWAAQWQELVPTFDASTFAESFNHYYFGLNTKGDLAEQCQQLLTALEQINWRDFKRI